MLHIYTEDRTSYIPDEDITIVWQCMYTTDGKTTDCIQRAITGWYYGHPDEVTTECYTAMPLIGQFFD